MLSPEKSITHKTNTKKIFELCGLYEAGHINLNPGFQRQSVWIEKQRADLIDSILRNYPLPAIFLYKREEKGKTIYDVIDGKQRLESILMFMGRMRGKLFSLRNQLEDSDLGKSISYKSLIRKGIQSKIDHYEIPVIEVDGELSDIIDVFVRINSTGKALTNQEKRHARHFNSELLKNANILAKRYENYFKDSQIFSSGQIARMKHIEFICELMISLLRDDVLNKKVAVDSVMKTNSYNSRELIKGRRLVTTTLNRVKKMFPHLRTTRFKQITDFYSLSFLIGKFEKEGLMLIDRRRNLLAWDILKAFSSNVDQVRDLQRKAQGAKPEQEIYREYLLTVSQMTDDINQRRKRGKILRDLIESLFAKKDDMRGFTPEQRRILWNSSATRICTYPGCRKKLGWNDFTIDHIQPHSKGGKSELENAALMCRMHNSKKGNRKH